MDLTFELGVWLGAAGFAVASAHVLLWRQRGVLRRSRQDVFCEADFNRLASAAVHKDRVAPSRNAELASSAHAS